MKTETKNNNQKLNKIHNNLEKVQGLSLLYINSYHCNWILEEKERN